MKAPATCMCRGNKACPLCKGAGFYLVAKDIARRRLIRDILQGKVKPDEEVG